MDSKEQFSFQAEIKQLLHLLSHSLYQSKEIALRELISNASDALDKRRYAALTDSAGRDDEPLRIKLDPDAEANRLVLSDNGIGMTRDDLVNNLGTIARSGSREFLKGLADKAKAGEGKAAELSLIGQFGVGFYSAFMIADNVTVRSKVGGEADAWEWESDGSGTFTVTQVDGAEVPRGTSITLHLKDDAREFTEDWKLKSVVRKYSSFVPYPIEVAGELVNDQKPIWVEPRSQVTAEQYLQFYRHLTHHAEETPLWHLHLAVDSPMQFRSILYCPPTNLESMGFGKPEEGLSLLARRVLVQDHCRDLLPDFLRFIRGLVDSEDLPLNVSRETLQDNNVIRRIRGVLVKNVFDRLTKMADEAPDDYLAFYKQFGTILREGVRDFEHRDRVGKLLRYRSSHTIEAGPDALTSLDAYIGRMPEGQSHIYYLSAPDLASLRKSPNLEIFRKRGVEVLYLIDPVDEFVLASLGAYAGKTLTPTDAAVLDLPGEDATKPENEPKPEDSAGLARVLTLFREALGDRVQDVRESKRLTDSPCCLVNADGAMSTQMQRILKMNDSTFQAGGRILEINPGAPLVRRLAMLGSSHTHDAFIKQCGLQLWSNALLLEGVVTEPEDTVARMQSMLEQAADARSPLIL
jgi:molecular chaperone HtpG